MITLYGGIVNVHESKTNALILTMTHRKPIQLKYLELKWVECHWKACEKLTTHNIIYYYLKSFCWFLLFLLDDVFTLVLTTTRATWTHVRSDMIRFLFWIFVLDFCRLLLNDILAFNMGNLINWHEQLKGPLMVLHKTCTFEMIGMEPWKLFRRNGVNMSFWCINKRNLFALFNASDIDTATSK